MKRLVDHLDAGEKKVVSTLRKAYVKYGPVRPAFHVALIVVIAAWFLLWLVFSRVEPSFYALANEGKWDSGIKALGGVLVLLGLYLTFRRIKVTEDGQVTTRFSVAIEHLGACHQDGNPNLEVRLGGIFALERIARDSPKDHWTVMEVLSAYVRENAPELKPRAEEAVGASTIPLRVVKTKEGNKYEKPQIDIQAALKVIGRRKDRVERERIDLHETRLCGAYLVEAKLSRAMLFETNLRHALLFDAILVEASMFDADLSNAVLVGGDLRDVDLKEAILQETDLRKVNLRGARDLTPEQLAVAIIDRNTILPGNLEQYQDKLLETSEANLARAISEGRMTPDALWQKP